MAKLHSRFINLYSYAILGDKVGKDGLIKMWKSIKPKHIVLKPGEVRKLSDDLIVEKTSDGRIVLYEVVDCAG